MEPATGKKKMGIGKKIGIGVGIAFAVFIILGVIGLAIGGNGGNTSNTSNQVSSQSESDSSPKITTADGSIKSPYKKNDVVTIDSISYTVINTQVGSTIGSFEKADGQYLIVTLSVLNNGRESETIYSNDFKLVDSKGRSFSYDTATVYLDNSIFLSQVNPGVTTTGRIAFDVPKDSDDYLLEISSNKLFGAGEKYIYVGTT